MPEPGVVRHRVRKMQLRSGSVSGEMLPAQMSHLESSLQIWTCPSMCMKLDRRPESRHNIHVCP